VPGIDGSEIERLKSDVLQIEERAFAAWPALRTVDIEGWVLRMSNGFTKRANSLNALRPRANIEVALKLALPLFAAAGLRPVVRLSPLAGPETDSTLADLGFHTIDESLVMVAPLDGRQTLQDTRAVIIDDAPSQNWLAGYSQANAVPSQHRATHDEMLARMRVPVAFAHLMKDGHPAAWGLAVAERGMVGLFDIVTAPAARRQGAARELVTELLAWGRAAGATRAYLQVIASNAAAIRLYQSLGFEELYRYHYRIGEH
jgi:ribosomal protein S18 acetylase RimI-like enzyme